MTEFTEVFVSPPVAADTSNSSAIAWAAVFAGGVTAAALTLVLLAFGSGMGFSSVSPWSNAGISASTFKIAAGIYLIVVAMLSSAIGGYIAGRLRTRWTGIHSDEVLFRDTAHGFLAWALATVIGAAVLGGAATYLAGGVTTGASQGAAQSTAQSSDPNAYFVDMMLRPGPRANGAATANPAEASHEVSVILTRAAANGFDLPPADRTYLAQIVSARTGLPQAEAERRVNEVITQAKAAADKARHAAAALSLWLTAAMLVGAFAASLAAIEGGQLRDGRWKPVIGGRNYRAGAVN